MKKNVVIIMTDQQRADLRKSMGFELDTMPFLDGFAKKGVDFKKAYTTMPACVPARTSMLTGRYPSATHVRTNHNEQDAYYMTDIVELLKRNGYDTALCGKNHSYKREDDFDYWYEVSHSGAISETGNDEEAKFDKYLENLKHLTGREATPHDIKCQLPYRAVSKAIDFVDNTDNPFFLWLSFPEPHNPYQVPEPYFSMFDNIPSVKTDENDLKTKGKKFNWLRKMWEDNIEDFSQTIDRTRKNYFGMLRLIDDQIKRFVEYIEQKDVLKDTIVIFVSDHGDFVGEYGLIRKGPELPELLCKIPMVFVGEGIKPKGINNNNYVSIVDIFPTICEMLDFKIPDGVQGRSIKDILVETNTNEDAGSIYLEQGYGGDFIDDYSLITPKEEGAINEGCTFDCLNSWTQSGTMRAYIENDWKIVMDMMGKGQLYNIYKDPFETNNLYYNNSFEDIKNEMTRKLLTTILRNQDPLPMPRKRYVYKS